MKTNLTDVKKRKFFQLEIDDNFRSQLDELATLDGVSASGIVRMLVHREYAFRFNGNGHQPSSTEQASQPLP
jgi:23S rRNA A1618 N6-methylase RlmF